ncbi:Cas10/Cmr2 second palm domain-containing protein [Dethiothermospora halolimnae]|uniref:Cas10/Cmr2 second palm domain-containing protein n=1 Tax=Dethiothermospora halolimnae TaxID=3114390 RepID=UPI003CCBA14A
MHYIKIDVSGKQEFIFKSNKLRDNIHASDIIRRITEYTNKDTVSNDKDILSLDSFLNNYKDKYKKEFCGGGNSILSFVEKDDAVDFIKNYSKKVYEKYPELELYIALYTKKDGIKGNQIKVKLNEELDRLKDLRKSRFRKCSFGVEVLDSITGYPIEGSENIRAYLDSRSSNEVEYKHRNIKSLKEINEAKKHLKDYLSSDYRYDEIKITHEMEDYKSYGEDKNKKYIGIISLDGNGMGDLVSKTKNFKELGNLGEEIQDVYIKSINDYLIKLDKYLHTFKEEIKPIRPYITPIVSAGDDICLIVDGKIAIDAASEILKNIEKNSHIDTTEYKTLKELLKRNDKDRLTACAGVSINKIGYPFFDVYVEAEEMCKRAKESKYKFIKILEDKGIDKNKYKDMEMSILDWNIIRGSNKEDYDFEKYIKNYTEDIYHVKPCIVSEDIEFKELSIYKYEKFKRTCNQVNSLIKQSKLTKSTLNFLQQNFYDGFSSYKAEIIKKRDKHTQELFSKIKEIYIEQDSKESNTVKKYGLIRNDYKNYFVLNDVIDTYEFFENINDTEKGGKEDE